jgi:N-acetylglucosaminyldiphosphoundecaprenol N-acetyl-beta-D-mannosaminyltransferase
MKSSATDDRPAAELTPVRRDILGFGIHALDWPGMVSVVDCFIRKKSRCQVTLLNVHSLITARKDPEFHQAIKSSHLVLCDSMALFWLSRILGRPLPGRIAGPDFCEILCGLAEKKAYRMFFLGSTPLVLQRLMEGLRARFPALLIAGAYSPPLRDRFGAADSSRMVEEINKADPDILWVGLTAPKQEKWLHENLPRLKCRVAAGVGAAFDFLAGTRRRAPGWVQRMGLEWLFRLCQEPRRLWKRYVISNSIFMLICAGEIAKALWPFSKRPPRSDAR